jgi:hypothetical protein
LHYFIVAFPEVKVEVDEIQRINSREIEVPALAFRGAVRHGHAQVEQLFFEESVEQSDKQVAVFFACECFFESQVERELGIATLRRKLVFGSDFVFRHRNPCILNHIISTAPSPITDNVEKLIAMVEYKEAA